MALLSRIGGKKAIAVIDVGSGYVGCAILSLSGKHGTVLSHAHSKLTLEARDDEHARARLAEEIAEAAKTASDLAAVKSPGLHVSRVYAILHAPWTESRILSAHDEFEAPTIVREPHISKLAAAALAGATGLDQSKTIEASTLSIALNGYPCGKPEGKRASRIELYAIVSSAETTLRTTIEEAIHAAFPSAEVSLRSAMRSYAATLLQAKYPHDVVVVDIGVQAASIFAIKAGIPAGQVTIPEGLAATLARVHGEKPPQETLSLFRMYSRDACADDACATLKTAIAAAEPDLAKVFGEGFAKLVEVERLAPTLILIAHPDVAPWLKMMFERIDFTQFTQTASPFTAEVLTSESVHDWLIADPGLDPALAHAAAHAVIAAQST